MKKFPKHINVPITEEMDQKIKAEIEALQAERPGTNKADWARVVFALALKKPKKPSH